MTMLTRNQQISRADLASNLTSDVLPAIDLPGTAGMVQDAGPAMVAVLDNEVGRQAMMIAYLDNFYAIFWLLVLIAPLPFLLRKPKQAE